LPQSEGKPFSSYQNTCVAARTYLAITGPYIAMNIVLTLIAAVSPPGVPPVMWAYLVVALLYLPMVVWVWLRERAQSQRGEVQVE
jgi:hypothetical protein